MGVVAGLLAGAYAAAATGVHEPVDLQGLLRFRDDGRDVTVYGLILVFLFAGSLTLTCGGLATAGRQRLVVNGANLAVKLTLLAAVIFMLAFPDLSQFDGKSLTYRAVLYPLLGCLIPALYRLRGMHSPYPALTDLCLSFTLVFDIVSNDLHYYGTWTDWDDIVHFWNSIPFIVVVAAPLLALDRQGTIRLGFWAASFFALTTYATLHSFWEMEEFLLDRYAGTNLQPGGMEEATGNTLAGLGGAVLGTAMLWFWRFEGALNLSLSDPLAAFFNQLKPARSEKNSPVR